MSLGLSLSTRTSPRDAFNKPPQLPGALAESPLLTSMCAEPLRFYTFTGNPLAETTMDFAAWSPGKTHRARGTSFQMGGKGINVSKMLRRLGAPTTALCFLGGHSGEQCHTWLQSNGFHFRPFTTSSPTRSGLVVRTPHQSETTFLGPDAPPDADAWIQAAEALSELGASPGPERAVLAFCGSSPGWGEPAASPFHAAIEAWLEAKNPLWVDTYGPPLAWFSRHPVDLIKINADELRGLLGTEAPVDDLLQQALSQFPVKAWIVSDGPGPVWYASKGESPRYQTPPVVHEISATGSGDVLLACLLHARLSEGKSWDDAVRYALPQASANAAHPGIAEF